MWSLERVTNVRHMGDLVCVNSVEVKLLMNMVCACSTHKERPHGGAEFELNCAGVRLERGPRRRE